LRVGVLTDGTADVDDRPPLYCCPDCDAMLTRVAVLALRLRKLSAQLHEAGKHAAGEWQLCDEEPCASTRRAFRYGGLS
jgi:hypothetical protein